MHRTITFSTFCDAFRDMGRNDNFSYEAKRILFDYLEQYEEDTGESIELDVVALCCDYNEMSWSIAAEEYGIKIDGFDTEECVDIVRDYLEYNTALCGEFEGPDGVTFVFQVF